MAILRVWNGTEWVPVDNGALASGSVLSGNIASGQIGPGHMSSGYAVGQSGITFDFTAGPPTIGINVSVGSPNFIINGGIDFAVRYGPTSGFTIVASNNIVNGSGSIDSYSANRFKVGVSSGGRVLFQQWNRLISGWASGAIAENYGAWMNGTSGHKMVIYQPVEDINSQGLANKKIQFQALAKSPTSGLLFRMGVLQTNSGVIANTIPTRVASGYAVGTSGTDPTWGSGVDLIGTASTFQLTTNWQVISTSGVQGQSGHVCLIPAVWSNNPMASGDTVHMTEIGMYEDDVIRTWNPRSIGQEKSLCDYYSQPIGQDTSNDFRDVAFGGKAGGTEIAGLAPITAMRVSPSLIHNITGWTNGSPATTTVSAINYSLGGFATISGTLTVSLIRTTKTGLLIDFIASNSFNGAVGDVMDLVLGPSVIAIADAEL